MLTKAFQIALGGLVARFEFEAQNVERIEQAGHHVRGAAATPIELRAFVGERSFTNTSSGAQESYRPEAALGPRASVNLGARSCTSRRRRGIDEPRLGSRSQNT